MAPTHFAEGFLLGLGLLAALGPKDTFVIKNSLCGRHALTLVAICTASDAFLIFLGVAGLGVLVSTHRWLLVLTMVLSIGYLMLFGLQALHSAHARQARNTELSAKAPDPSRAKVVRGALFHSLLTPYAWLDTVLVIGAISATKAGTAKIGFASGAIVASLLWFIFLTAGSRLAAPLFQNRRAWQGLDLLIAACMLGLAAKLAVELVPLLEFQ